MADAYGSGPYGSNTVRVQVPFPAFKEVINIGGLRIAFIMCKQKCKQPKSSLVLKK